MLKDPRWDETKTTTLEPWRRLLLDAADYMETHGHCKANFWDAEGQVCLAGAILSVQKVGDVDNCYRAWRALQAATGAYDMILWNDAPERTAAEVIQTMREVALS